jgi:repressor LexA
MAKGLTRRQETILHYIVTCIRDNGMPPTIAEIGRRFNISSTNGVNDHLVALERKGYIQRSSKARSIRVTEKGAAGLYGSGATMVPLVGRIAAGSPILAEENIEDTIPVAPALDVEDGYALRVQGDSMIEDGILDGDTILVNPKRRARKGDIVVALVDDEATVKRFYPQGDMVELRPANAAMQSIIVPARDVQLQGVVVGLQRTLG